MGDFITDWYKNEQSKPGPIGTQSDAYGTPRYDQSPYAFPYQRGTNLPWSYQKNEPLPTWNGSRPVDRAGQPTVGAGAVPMQTGNPGSYGGSITWFDPSSGVFRDQHGHITDNTFTGSQAGPEAWAALAAAAKGNPGGMLTPEDFQQAMQASYGRAVGPGAAGMKSAERRALGLPQDAHLNAPLSPQTARFRYQQALTNGNQITDPRLLQYIQANGLAMPSAATRTQGAPYNPNVWTTQNPTMPTQPSSPQPTSGLATTTGGGLNATPAAGAGAVTPTPGAPTTAPLDQVTQILQALSSDGLGGINASSTLDIQKLRQLFAALQSMGLR